MNGLVISSYSEKGNKTEVQKLASTRKSKKTEGYSVNMIGAAS